MKIEHLLVDLDEARRNNYGREQSYAQGQQLARTGTTQDFNLARQRAFDRQTAQAVNSPDPAANNLQSRLAQNKAEKAAGLPRIVTPPIRLPGSRVNPTTPTTTPAASTTPPTTPTTPTTTPTTPTTTPAASTTTPTTTPTTPAASTTTPTTTPTASTTTPTTPSTASRVAGAIGRGALATAKALPRAGVELARTAGAMPGTALGAFGRGIKQGWQGTRDAPATPVAAPTAGPQADELADLRARLDRVEQLLTRRP